MCIGGAGVGAKAIPSYGPVYAYKGGSGPADGERQSDPHPHTAHVMSGQSGSGTAHYRLVGSMSFSVLEKPLFQTPRHTYRQGT